jgi:thiol:disulfide interchange protein DsbC
MSVKSSDYVSKDMRGMIMKKFLTTLVFVLLLAFSGCKQGVTSFSCPKVETVQKVIDGMQRGLTVEKVEPSEVSGLCSVILKVSDTDKGLVYVDSQGKYLVLGNIIEVSTKKNLTQEKLALINKIVLNPTQLAELEKRVAFVHGKSDKFVYFITDPDCPFCKKAEEMLDELVKQRKLAVKVIFFPLEQIHPEAKAKAISIICDKKGFEGLRQGYKSKNQCEAGRKLVEDSKKFLSTLGIKGTPTFVFPDGELRSGLIPKEVILQKLGLKE